MTAIKGHIKSERRPGELGVHSLDHFHFVVPDLPAAETFYSEFGLAVSPKARRPCARHAGSSSCLGHDRRRPAQEAPVHVVRRLRGRHRSIRQAPPGDGDPETRSAAGVDSNGLWFHDHDGNLIEIAVAPKTSPSEKSEFGFTVGGPGERAAPFRREVKRTHPRRLAHMLMFTRDVTKAMEFYTRVLGMRVSDHSGDGIAFLHGVHGSDHHMVAFGKSNAPGFHHLSWDVGSVDEIGVGATHMLGKGYSRGWGLGRHVLGSNYFHYVRDPWGSYSEYSAGIDFVPVDYDWAAADNAPEDSFYVWGPNPPEDFVQNYEA